MVKMRTAKWLAAGLAAGMFVLSACSGTPDNQPGPAPHTASANPSSADSVSSTRGSTPAASGEPRCGASLTNPLYAASQLPIVDGGGEQLTFDVIDDHFDPCAELSWSVIAGGVGPGNSQRQGVVFFTHGTPVTAPAPLLQEEIVAVERLTSTTVKVSYEILVGPRAAATTIPGTATFQVAGEGQLAVVENLLPNEANEAGIQVDVSGLK